MVGTKRTRIFQCNDHRVDELFSILFGTFQASNKNNFIGRVNLSLTMKTMFLRHSQKSINSKLKFKGSEWKPSRAFWILLSLQFVQHTSFQKIYQTLIVSDIAISQWKLRKILLTWFFFSETLKTEIIIKPFFIKPLPIFSPTTKCGLLIFTELHSADFPLMAQHIISGGILYKTNLSARIKMF